MAAATLDAPLYLTDTAPNKKTLTGTHPILDTNKPVIRKTSFTIAQIKDASGSTVSKISTAQLVRCFKVPVGVILEEMEIGLTNHSIVAASTTLTAGLGANSNALVTTLITAAKGEVTKNTVVRMTDRLTTLNPNVDVTVAASSSSNSADVVSILAAGAAMSHVASGTITVAVKYRQA